MIIAKNLKEAEDSFPTDLYELVKGRLEALADEYEEPVEETLESSFESLYGGNYHYCNMVADVKDIPSGVGDKSLAEVAGVFDVVVYVLDGAYLEVALMTNNSGGNSYFIPRAAVVAYPTIQETIDNASLSDQSGDSGSVPGVPSDSGSEHAETSDNRNPVERLVGGLLSPGGDAASDG